ncbi:MAG: HAMP domain-containing protein [Gammaproteobacteria bacterium]|nr:HAMP domain-containing protein [Gammaproteobacteria bacterium]
MKENLPVTDKIYTVREDHVLNSKTDLRGIIVDASKDFVEVSGFSSEELIYSSHNINRHPDVPSLVFKDLWMTIQSGKCWNQVVKNRRKNGDAYYVVANVAPYYNSKQQHVGYLSVRTPASEEQIQAIGPVYKKIGSGELVIREGVVMSRGSALLQDINPMSRMGISGKLGGIFLATMLAVLGMLAWVRVLPDESPLLWLPSIFVVAGTIGVWIISRQQIIEPLQIIKETIRCATKNHRLSSRIKLNRQDEFGEIANAYNEMMQVMQSSISETNDVTKMTAAGHFDRRITIEMGGDFSILKETVNRTIHNNFRSINSLYKVLIGLAEGNFSSDFKLAAEGDFEVMLTTAKEAIDKLAFAHSEINEVVQQMAQGDFSGRISVSLQGEFSKLRDNINRSLKQLEDGVNNITETANLQAEGKLYARIEGEYQGQLAVLQATLNASTEEISKIVAEVQSSSTTLSKHATRLSEGSSRLADLTQQQAASVEQTVASMETMASSVDHSTGHSGEAAELASEATSKTVVGSKIMVRATTSMEQISSASDQIGEIISVIDSIAFQTNLLALNAAVEAARAGEQGRGFAVVAGEVRALAQRSADAAKQIKELIERTLELVKVGAAEVGQLGDSLGDIQGAVDKVNLIVSEISDNSREQKQGITQVNQAMQMIDSATQSNAQQVEDSAADSSALDEQSQRLSQLMSRFHLQG